MPLPVYVIEGFCMTDILSIFWLRKVSTYVVNADNVIMTMSQVTKLADGGALHLILFLRGRSGIMLLGTSFR